MKKLFGKLAALIFIFVIGVIGFGWEWLNDLPIPLQVLFVVLILAVIFVPALRRQTARPVQDKNSRDIDMDDLFATFFGSGAIESGDCSQWVWISKNEAALGCVKTLNYKIRKHCEKCSGTDVGVGGSATSCPKCNGKGRKATQTKTAFGEFHSTKHCKKCDGRGKIIKGSCEKCNGYGGYEAQEQQYITIPANISENNISIQGKGHYIDANTRGNLIVTVLILDG